MKEKKGRWLELRKEGKMNKKTKGRKEKKEAITKKMKGGNNEQGEDA